MAFTIAAADNNPPSPGFNDPDPVASVVPPLVVALTGQQSLNSNDGPLQDWTGTVRCLSDDAHWDNGSSGVVFDVAGLFEVTLSVRYQNDESWQNATTILGTQVGGTSTVHMFSDAGGAFPVLIENGTTVAWSDTFVVSGSAGSSYYPSVYGNAYGSPLIGAVTVQLIVRRLGDEIAAS